MSGRHAGSASAGTGVVRLLLAIGIANAAMLAGASGARAQDVANVSPFVNVDPAYVGDVLSNTSTIDNNDPGDWTGDVLGNTGTVTNNLGASWAGDVTNNGTVRNYGSWTGGVDGNFVHRVENIGSGAEWVGDIRSNHSIITNSVDSVWRGDIVSNGDGNRDNWFYYVDNAGAWFGDVLVNSGTLYNSDGVWTGDVYGNTGTIANNFPTTSNDAEWVGDVLGNDWLIGNYGIWRGDVVDNPGDIVNYTQWIGDLTNRGRIINTGVWTGNVIHTGTFFWAENEIDGNFDNRGWVQLLGDLSITETLTNSGRLQLTHNRDIDRVDIGPLQTLSVGSLVLTPDSSYELDITAAGGSDLIVVTGAATLGGTVAVTAEPGAYNDTTTYTILTAASLDGTFAGVTTDLAFFAARLTYDATDVMLTLLRNDQGFGSIGTTPNQTRVGTIVEAFGAGNPIYDAVLWLSGEEAAGAFDSLSGEAHASSGTAYVQQAHFLSDIVTGRIEQHFNAPPAGEVLVSSLGDALPFIAVGGRDVEIWGRVYGARGKNSASGNTAGMDTSSGGIVGGIDGMIGGWRTGLMLHAGTTASDVSELHSSFDSDDYGLGVYGGRAWGNTRLSLGASYTWHDIDSGRFVVFPGFTENLSAGYTARTAQVFGELSHEIGLGAISLAPYFGLAHVRHDTQGFTETGGTAALSGSDNSLDATFTTVGLGARHTFDIDGNKVAAKGKLGWRHAFADTASARQSFSSGPDFTVVGTPVDEDTLVLGAGLGAALGAGSAIGLTYDGQLASDFRMHAVSVSWTVSF